jgi:hypothetical protein
LFHSTKSPIFIFCKIFLLLAWYLLFLKEETPTLAEFLKLMAECIGITPQFKVVDDDDDEDVDEYYPSVECGPIDISKALQQLKWKPIPLKDALQPTCNFFEDAWHQFPELLPLDDFSEDMISLLKERYKRTV